MTATVLNLNGENVGENYNVTPDIVLEGAKGALVEVVVVGVEKDGTIFLAGSKGSMHTLWLLEAGKHVLMRDELSDES